MQVILLATDEATKLHPMTGAIPAPLVTIANRPLIDIALEILARAGLRQVTISLYHRSGAIAAYVGDGSRWGMTVTYASQREALGTAGAIRWGAGYRNEPVLVIPADAVLDLDIEAALAYHHAHGALATLVVHRAPASPPEHMVWLDEQGVLLPASAPGAEALAATGAYILEPEAVQRIPQHAPYDTITDLVPQLAADGLARGYTMAGYWNNLSMFAAYRDAQRVFLYSAYEPAGQRPDAPEASLPRVRFPSIEGHQIAPGIWVGIDHAIHPTARLAAPVCIGPGVRVGSGVDIGPDTVIGQRVVIDDDATVEHSVVLGATYVGQLVNVSRRAVMQNTVIDLATGQSSAVTDPFLLDRITMVPVYDLARRIISVTAALVLMALTLPLALVVAALVVLTSGPRAIVAESRSGRRPIYRRSLTKATPEVFGLLAFRTRRADGAYTLLGRWLERLEINHLPVLWNIVRGDLDLVGVRPLLLAQANEVVETWQERRNECPMGITGLWFVQDVAEADLDATLIADAYYVATRSWRTDLRLLWQTPGAWARRVRRKQGEDAYNLSALQEGASSKAA
jgi:NDP-sugar pyrophosphorylase family protein